MTTLTSLKEEIKRVATEIEQAEQRVENTLEETKRTTMLLVGRLNEEQLKEEKEQYLLDVTEAEKQVMLPTAAMNHTRF